MKKTFKLVSIILAFLFFNSVYSQQIQRGVRISYYISDAQIDFINNHFQHVMTPFLSEEVRNEIQGPELYLYRSIQGTWTDFDHFDWDFITSYENMFCHDDSLNQNVDSRILTIWDSWLMDGNDLVDTTDPNYLDHWINYYAETASNQVHEYSYDGLFIDSAGHGLHEHAIAEGGMPWDYSDDTWREGRYAALSFIKSYMPDKTVIFNGLHGENGADSSLLLTDGGMWEDFAYNIETGEYKGFSKWGKAIQCLNENKEIAKLILVVKKPDLIDDIQARVFSAASFLLANNENVALSMVDWSYEKKLQFYPEYEIDLGYPLGDLEEVSYRFYKREFDDGFVLVNPSSDTEKTYFLDTDYEKIIPSGGGIIDETGNYNGELSYEIVSGQIVIPPVSAVILKEVTTTGFEEQTDTYNDIGMLQNYPNPAKNAVTISFFLPKTGDVELSIYDTFGQKVMTLEKGGMAKGEYNKGYGIKSLLPDVYFVCLSVIGDECFRVVEKLVVVK